MRPRRFSRRADITDDLTLFNVLSNTATKAGKMCIQRAVSIIVGQPDTISVPSVIRRRLYSHSHCDSIGTFSRRFSADPSTHGRPAPLAISPPISPILHSDRRPAPDPAPTRPAIPLPVPIRPLPTPPTRLTPGRKRARSLMLRPRRVKTIFLFFSNLPPCSATVSSCARAALSTTECPALRDTSSPSAGTPEAVPPPAHVEGSRRRAA